MKYAMVHPCTNLCGTLRVPGDKSISHRAVMLAALAQGVSRLRGLLLGEDVLCTVRCFQAMGVDIRVSSDEVHVAGVGLHGLKAPQQVLDCGNSGTTLRLMMGLLAGQPFESRLTGDASLNRRPIERVAQPLRAMGASIEEYRASAEERVVKVVGRPLCGIRYVLPVASAQVKSAVFLAGLYARGQTLLEEKWPSRDHTEIMLQHRGVALGREGLTWSLQAPEGLRAMDATIPGDISSAAFFLVAAAIARQAKVRLPGVGVNPTRTGVLDVLQAMSAQVEIQNPRSEGGEAVADLEVRHSALRATQLAGPLIPRLIDEIPVLMVAAAAASGSSRVCDAAELRVKESDRIAALQRELSKLGAQIHTYPDGLSVSGPSEFRSATFESGGDHRIAMSMAVAATRGSTASRIEDTDCVATSYPDFFEHLRQVGGRVDEGLL